jgi:hypothetical protein
MKQPLLEIFTLTLRITLHFSYRTDVKLENFQQHRAAPHFSEDVDVLKHSISSFLRSINWPLLSEDSKVLTFSVGVTSKVPCTGHVANLDKLKVISATAESVAPAVAVL